MKRNLLVVLATTLVCATIGPLAPLAQAQRGGATVTLDPAAKAALLTALAGPDGEYAAHAEYSAILQKFGATVQPYASIVLAERQHIAALQQQCVKFGVPVPADPYLGKVNPPATLLEAAKTGVFAENLNVAMYTTLLTQVQRYPSLVQVFTHLQAASQNNHLPAFEAAVKNGGTTPGTGTGRGGQGGPGKGTGTPDCDQQRLRDGSCQAE